MWRAHSQGFKTDTGNAVVHTTNSTVYKLCSTGVTASGGGSGWKPEGAFLAVMLTTEGANYFSDAWNGEHCQKGMRFQVSVARGRGLPSVPPSYYEPLSGAAPAGDATRRDWGRVRRCDGCSLCCICVFLIIYSQHKVIAGVFGHVS